MRLLRALDKLSVGIDRNEAFLETRLKPENATILLQRGIIAVVKTPPLLIMLPEHAAEFERLGVTTFEELFDCDSADALKNEALALFQPETEICINCSRR